MWAESRTVPILDEAGAVTSSLSVLIDITGTARYQKQVEEMSQDAQDFAYMVSHDLKAPLATLKGMLTILQEEQQSPSSAGSQEALGHMERATKRLETLIQGVLDYSRVNGPTVESEPLTLHTIFRDIQKDFEPSLKSASAYFDAHDGGLSIVGDPLRAYQIFSNLVSNALKYRDPIKPQRIAIRASHSAGSRWVQVTVSDTGLGIPADKLHSIFRPFVRIHTQGTEGAGVGLACVKKMIEKLGGEVSVTSTLGLGTEFTLKFVKAVDGS
jgi:signal transduction histidine kinase